MCFVPRFTAPALGVGRCQAAVCREQPRVAHVPWSVPVVPLGRPQSRAQAALTAGGGLAGG